MSRPVVTRGILVLLLIVLLALFCEQAIAAVDSVGVLNKVTRRFEDAAKTWQSVMLARATWLFWLLALISMVWTFGFMALRNADIGEFFAEFIRFTLFTGFFWWLLENGPRFAVDIMKSLREIGADASNLPNELEPSTIVDVGFDIFFKVIDQSSGWKPMDSLFGMLLGIAILIVFALVGTNMLLLLVSGYIFAYAGVFVLGFGGSKWTSEMAIGYYKSILNIGLQLMTMVLIVGIGRSFVDQYYASMNAGINLKEMGVMTVVAAVLLFLVAKLPSQVGALAGGSTSNLGSYFGIGAAVGAAAMGAAAIGSAGTALTAGAANIAGGTQALMAAFSKANAAESGSSGSGTGVSISSSAPTSGRSGGGDNGGSPLSAAMGDDGTNFSASSRAFAASDSPTSAGIDSPDVDTTREADKGADSERRQSSVGGKRSEAEGTGHAANNDGSTSGSKPAIAPGASRAIAAKAGRVVVGTATNLTKGAWDVAKNEIADMKVSASGRIGETAGGKIAFAIRASTDVAKAAEQSTEFDADSLAPGNEAVDEKAEIAAFRDRDPKST
jgi:type IV secretion system protein TrbL